MSRFDRNALWLHFYLVFIDFIGFSKDLTMLNCKVLKEKSPYAVSGVLFVSRVLENIWDFTRGLCQGTQGEEMTVKTLTYQVNQKEPLGRFLPRYIFCRN